MCVYVCVCVCVCVRFLSWRKLSSSCTEGELPTRAHTYTFSSRYDFRGSLSSNDLAALTSWMPEITYMPTRDEDVNKL